MFGRILSVEVFDINGDSTFLVDSEQETRLACNGTIEYLPAASGAPRATLEVYNLPATFSETLFANHLLGIEKDGDIRTVKMLRICFGYEDENGGKTSAIFVGKIARAFNTRYDATTVITRIYAYQLVDMFTTAVSSVLLEAGMSIYECMEKLFENCSVKGADIQIPDALRAFKIGVDLSCYGKTLDYVSYLARTVDYIVVTTPLGMTFSPVKPSQGDLDVVVLARYTEDGKVEAQSGLIGFPCIDTEGMRFETLINPNIRLFTYVWVPSSAILDQRVGYLPTANFGATYDPAGLYRVVKMTTKFDSQVGDCKTSYVALSAGASSKYFK